MERLEARITKSRSVVKLLVAENLTSKTDTIDELVCYSMDAEIWETIKGKVEEDSKLNEYSIPCTEYPYGVKRLTILFLALRYPHIRLKKEDDVRDKKTFCEYVLKNWAKLTKEQIEALYGLANEHSGSIVWRTAIQNAISGFF